MKNLLFLDNNFWDESDDIIDKDLGNNETSVVAMTTYVIVERRME